MIQIMNVKKSQVSNLKIIVDFSYAWVIIYDYLELLQHTVTKKAKSVLLLKTVFLKLSTIMDRPLKRIFEIDSEDRHSVQMFYSRQLFNFIKAVLYVIPVNIFTELDSISKILAIDLTEFEVKVSKEFLKGAIHQEKRFELA
jgi:WASH complex subunit strumpellin